MTTTTTVKCWNCGGFGTVETGEVCRETGYHLECECDVCKGDGWMEVEDSDSCDRCPEDDGSCSGPECPSCGGCAFHCTCEQYPERDDERRREEMCYICADEWMDLEAGA